MWMENDEATNDTLDEDGGVPSWQPRELDPVVLEFPGKGDGTRENQG